MPRWNPGRALMALTASAVLLTATFAAPAAAEPLSPETMLAERTNPAMHLITVDYSAKVSMKETDWSGDGKRLRDLGFDMLASGELGSVDEVLYAIFGVAAKDPERYFKGIGKTKTKPFTSSGSGSGFMVDGTGYLATARHVVTADGNTKQDFVRRGAAAFAADETKIWKKIYAEYGVSDGTVEVIRKAMTAYATARATVAMSPPKVSVVLGVASADGSRTGKRQPAEVVYRSNPELHADIALLRIRGLAQLPTVSLAEGSLPQGAPVYLNCFPALPDRSEAALLTPTMTDGRVTALKPNEGGIVEMQTDAQASPGCSGGAGLNQEGNVVGVLVSGAVDGKGDSLGQFYLMPVDLVREALQSRNIPVAVSLTTQEYDQALAAYSRDYYTQALGRFTQVRSLYPPHPYVTKYISDSQTKISQGKDRTPPPEPTTGLLARLPTWAPAGAAALAGVGLVAGGLLLVGHRRRARTAPPAPSTDGPADPGPTGPVRPQPVEDPAYGAAYGSNAAAEHPLGAVPPGSVGPGGYGEPPTGEAGADRAAPDAAGDPDTFPAEDDWAPIGFVPSVPPTVASSSTSD